MRSTNYEVMNSRRQAGVWVIFFGEFLCGKMDRIGRYFGKFGERGNKI